MSPIFVRPVREQLEHDRLIRFLQTKYKRKVEALVNVGEERVAPVKIGTGTFFPDLVLVEGKKLVGVVEVESGESVNNLEVMAQWVHFAKARVPFHLYVPVTGYDSARRLCEAYKVRVTEVWTYRPAAEGFDLVRMWHDAAAVGASNRAAAASNRAEAAVKAAAAPTTAPAAKTAPAPKAPAAAKPSPQAGQAKKPVGKPGKAAKPAAKAPPKATRAPAKAAKKPAKKAKPASRRR